MIQKRVRKEINHNQPQQIFQQPTLPVHVEFIMNENLPKQPVRKMKRSTRKGIVKYKRWEWQMMRMQSICPFVSKWDITGGLHIQSSQDPNILEQISGINFQSMQTLSLPNNGILSIDALCRIFMPNLEKICLTNNKITNVSAFRKASLPKLVSCSLGGNKINQFSSLSQLNCPNLKRFSQQYRGDSNLCSSFKWIAKLLTSDLQQLYLRSDDRIWQGKAQKSLQRRFRKRREIIFYVGVIHGTLD